jgi:hypothetical protein
MHRSLLIAILILPAAIWPAVAQTLSARPALFADPVPGADLSKGELVLGRTTLSSALRIFSVELEEDSVRVPLGHGANPAPLSGAEVLVGGLTIRPRHRLDLGRERYTLYFDENERLVAALTAPARARPLRRKQLVARYPNLRAEHTGTGYEGLVAVLDHCVSLTARIWLRHGDEVDLLGYTYTCTTKPEKHKVRH